MADAPRPSEYQVVARRYRPQNFAELIGQDQVSQALRNAINTGRVGHAYLFTGARGVGKTSSARILAKCLNCVDGPTPTPCGQCDSCQAIAVGEDVDVLEIDGASNRGIDEIRALRANVNIRPSRSHFKIYIIDEVHMLTVPAFNALLKTLEEPPEHVKFIFCTTDSEKVPITVVSRCQKFDFAGIRSESIAGRLRQIVEAEGIEAEDAALALLARRAGGSMRDSQSLLEQLLSFGGKKITVQDVHTLLGTASSGRVSALVKFLLEKDAAGALAELDAAATEGVDPGQLVEQLMGYFRDMMAAAVGCSPDLMFTCHPEEAGQLAERAAEMGLETILAAVQILDQTAQRMRHSGHVRLLAEMAVVRICRLEQLDQLAALVAQFREGGFATGSPSPAAAAAGRSAAPRGSAPPMPEKKTSEVPPVDRRVDNRHVSPPPAPVQTAPAAPSRPHESGANGHHGESNSSSPAGTPLTVNNVKSLWEQALRVAGGMTAQHAERAANVAISGPNRLVITFPQAYTSSKAFCERPDKKAELEQALKQVTGQVVMVEISASSAASPVEDAAARPTRVPQAQLRRQVANNPFVQQAMEMFDATIVEVFEGRSGGGT